MTVRTSRRPERDTTRADRERTTAQEPLKIRVVGADDPGVYFERLVIESGDNSISFDLHPRLTVISGLEQMERDGLVNEFIGALGNSRSGVHRELMADNGHRYAVFRPTGANHRVIDVDERIEIGWIGHSAIPLTELAQRYLAELRTVVAGFGVALLG